MSNRVSRTLIRRKTVQKLQSRHRHRRTILSSTITPTNEQKIGTIPITAHFSQTCVSFFVISLDSFMVKLNRISWSWVHCYVRRLPLGKGTNRNAIPMRHTLPYDSHAYADAAYGATLLCPVCSLPALPRCVRCGARSISTTYCCGLRKGRCLSCTCGGWLCSLPAYKTPLGSSILLFLLPYLA